MTRLGAWVRTGAAVARRPRLWRPAVVQVRRLAPPRWWARRPFLPVPDAAWMRFRLETQYGDASHPPVPADVVTWLEWTAAENSGPSSGTRR